jgi:hypothetical protein
MKESKKKMGSSPNLFGKIKSNAGFARQIFFSCLFMGYLLINFPFYTLYTLQIIIPYASLKNYRSLVHLIYYGIYRNFFRKTSYDKYAFNCDFVISIDFSSMLQHNRGTIMRIKKYKNCPYLGLNLPTLVS